jgi:hypothetical protein
VFSGVFPCAEIAVEITRKTAAKFPPRQATLSAHKVCALMCLLGALTPLKPLCAPVLQHRLIHAPFGAFFFQAPTLARTAF